MTDQVAITALLTGLVVRLVKSDAFDRLLHKMTLPSIPRTYLPGISLVTGLVITAVWGVASGAESWPVALRTIFEGLMPGSLAVAGHEAFAPDGPRGRIGAFVFGVSQPGLAFGLRRMAVSGCRDVCGCRP